MENTGQNAIDEKTAQKDYRSKVISETIFFLQINDYSWLSNLGYDTYNTVIEIENESTKNIIAAKIMLEENLKISEKIIWPSLKHDNVIPFIGCYFLSEPHTLLFLMPKHRTALTNVIETAMLHNQEKVFNKFYLGLKQD